jgi:hypothetical protein
VLDRFSACSGGRKIWTPIVSLRAIRIATLSLVTITVAAVDYQGTQHNRHRGLGPRGGGRFRYFSLPAGRDPGYRWEAGTVPMGAVTRIEGREPSLPPPRQPTREGPPRVRRNRFRRHSRGGALTCILSDPASAIRRLKEKP